MTKAQLRQRLSTLSPTLMVLSLTLCAVLLVLTAWLNFLKPTWLKVKQGSRQARLLQSQVQQVDAAIKQLPHLTQIMHQETLLPAIKALPDRMNATALTHPVFIRELLQVDAHHWQAQCLGTYQQLHAFVHDLSQQTSDWTMQSQQWQPSANEGPLSLTILWTNVLTAHPNAACQTTNTSNPDHDPFALSTDTSAPLTRYPLAQLEWLGLLRDTIHSGALIQLPNHAIRLVVPGDTLGTEHWRLSQLTEHYAEFIDPNQQPQRLSLTFQTNSSPEVNHG